MNNWNDVSEERMYEILEKVMFPSTCGTPSSLIIDRLKKESEELGKSF
jgi:hypothetical protein